MKKLKYFGDESTIYYEKMSNGLDLYIVPNNQRDNYHLELVVKYGSSIKEFIPVGKKDYLKLPLGVAHFLEHKVFDMENSDAFAFFSKTGTYVNAGTNYFSTRFYINGRKNFKENFDYLLNLVFTPYLKEESVNSEKGIIEEEIKMYDDEADWILDNESKRNVFYTTLVDKIAGTKESIEEINADILNQTYNTFYQASNMFIVATGNVDFDEIKSIIEKNKCVKKANSNQTIVFKKEEEPVEVRDEYKSIEASIIIPKLSYSYKFDLNTLGKDSLLNKLYLNLLFTHLFSDTSEFSSKVLHDRIAVNFYVDHISFDNIYVVTLEAESEFADLFKDEVDNAINNISITEEDFNRIKKIWLSIIIRSLDSKEALAHSIVEDVLKEGSIVDQEELINKINYQDLLKVISKLDLSNKSFVLMLPKEKD